MKETNGIGTIGNKLHTRNEDMGKLEVGSKMILQV